MATAKFLSEKFAKLAATLKEEGLIDEVPAGERKAFGSNGLKVNGKLFALDVRGGLVLKLPKSRVDALVESKSGENFDPGHGRAMKEWIHFARWPRNATALAREAREFVARSGK